MDGFRHALDEVLCLPQLHRSPDGVMPSALDRLEFYGENRHLLAEVIVQFAGNSRALEFLYLQQTTSRFRDFRVTGL